MSPQESPWNFALVANNSWVTHYGLKNCQQIPCLLRSATTQRKCFSASVASVFFDSSSALTDSTEPQCLEACSFIWHFFAIWEPSQLCLSSLFFRVPLLFSTVVSCSVICKHLSWNWIVLQGNQKSSPISASCAFSCVLSYVAPYFRCDSHLIMLKP